jgi:DNA-binding response OmpR family regulator
MMGICGKEMKMASKKKILIVDDDEDIAETLKFVLEQAGFEVVTAYDGFDAFVQTVMEKPDLVILDVMLPKENGHRVSRAIKDGVGKGIYGKNIIVLALTGLFLEKSGVETRFIEESRADCIMYKPFEMEDLMTKVEELLAKEY